MREAVENRARARLDAAFGLGKDQAHAIIRSDVGAKRIYDAALDALTRAEIDLDAALRGKTWHYDPGGMMP